MSRTIPLSVPNLKGRELEYVTKAIEEEWVSTGGPYVNDFENSIAAYVKADGAVACQNGTSGLHTALLLCEVTGADEVIVPTLTFIAAVNPVRYIGAEPLFMDCDDSLTMDADKLDEFCRRECSFIGGRLVNNRTKKQIKVVLVVHVFGNMADMEKIMTVAARYNLKVVEDATEAIGTCYTEGKYSGRFAGTIGTVGVYSFNGNKIITTGGGGMIVSGDAGLLRKARHLTTQAKSDELYYTHDEVGYNYRMTNLQAALGLAQLEQLEGFIETKARNYHTYKRKIEEVGGLSLLGFKQGIRPNYWFYSLLIDKAAYGLDRDELLKRLAGLKIQTRPVWGLIHEQKPYLHNQAYRIEKAGIYRDKILNIPCSTNLTEADIDVVVEALKSVK